MSFEAPNELGLTASDYARLVNPLLSTLVHSQVLIGLYDADDILRYANQAFSERFLRELKPPMAFAEIIRYGFAHGFGVHISTGDIERFLGGVQSRRRTEAFRAFEVDMIGGEWLWMTETLVETGHLLSIASTITTLKHNERTLRQARDTALFAAQTDALTSLANRRHVLEQGHLLLEQCEKSERPFSIVVIDIDHFKHINDSLGHDSGDEVLRQFSALCLALLRQDDRLGRIGGEEFLLLLPGANEPAALEIVELIRDKLRPISLTPGETPLRYTFSAGIAQARPAEALRSLMKRADRALYSAKANGRNRTEVSLSNRPNFP